MQGSNNLHEYTGLRFGDADPYKSGNGRTGGDTPGPLLDSGQYNHGVLCDGPSLNTCTCNCCNISMSLAYVIHALIIMSYDIIQDHETEFNGLSYFVRVLMLSD